MFKKDNIMEHLRLDLEFNLNEKGYNDLQSFIHLGLKEAGEIYPSPLASFKNLAINVDVGNEYSSFRLQNDCLLVRRIYLPVKSRGKGIFTKFLESLELFLPEIGVNKICFENIENEELLKFLIKNNYCKAYFNNYYPEAEGDFDMPDAYKILK